METTVALVTGGASGMGQVYALRMAQRGVKVALLDANAEALEQVAAQSDKLIAFPCDVTSLEQVTAVVERVVATLGPIDRLVHCAAIMPTAELPEQDIDVIQRLMSVNYGGTVNVCKTRLARMRQRGKGEIVLFGSLGGSVPVLDCGAYCASKAAVNCFAEVLIEENRGSGVHIMLVCPALVDTPLLQQSIASSNPRAIRESIANKHFVAPDFIIDKVEQGLRRRTEILLPGVEAKLLARLRRFAPRMLWKIIHRSSHD